MADEDTGERPQVSSKELEDAEVLVKSAEIDINEAEKTGADLSEAKMYLDEARAFLSELNIKQVRISVKKAKTAAADAKRYHRADLLIKHALPVVNDARRAGADASAAESFIERARESLQNKMYGDVSEHIRSAKREAKEAKRYHRAYLMIENSKNDIANAKMVGADVTEAEKFLDEARAALEKKDYGVVSQLVRNAKNAATKLQKHMKVKELIAGLKPEVESLKHVGVQTEEIEELLVEAESSLEMRDYAEVRSLIRKIKRRIKKAMERKAANVLIATIDHIMHKAEARGLDATDLRMLFERAKVAAEKIDHSEIEQIISELNAIAKSLNIPIGSLASDLFSKAKLVDLEKIDMIFSEAERKISAEMARARITAMRDLLTSAKELGIEGPEFMTLLKKAEEAFEAKDFDIIEEYKESFEDKLDEAKVMHRTDIIGKKIEKVRAMIAQLKEQKIKVERAEELLMLADQELSAHNFEKADEHADNAQKTAKEHHQKHDTEHELESIKNIITEARDSGVDIEEANSLLTQAEIEIGANNVNQATELIQKAKSISSNRIQDFIEGKSPKFLVKLPETGIEADTWNKCTIEIANTGDIGAKNVDMIFKGDMDVKGLSRIEKLGAGEKKRMEIGVKPKESGKLDMDVLFKYQRAFDETVFQLDMAMKIMADTSGTYLIEEVLLIHRSGILISQASRKMEMDIDRDIFSGMFTAVQDFIRDSFQKTADVGLKRMDFGANKILLEHGNNIFLTAITIGGEPRFLPLFMVEILREVQEKYGPVLEKWRGDHSEVDGVDEIIARLLHVTDEKGADVAGFESGKVAETIRLIEAAEADGILKGGQEAFVEEFIETMQNMGFEHAWNYIEDKGEYVTKEINTEKAKEKISAMRDLLSSAKEWGISTEETLSIVSEAESALASENFDVIDEYKDTFEKKMEEAKFKQRTDIIERRINNALVLISQFKDMGVDVGKPEELLAMADLKFKAGEYEKAEELVDEAEQIADEMRRKHDVEIELNSVRKTQDEIRELGVDVGESDVILIEAENEIIVFNLEKARELIKKARNIISNNIEDFIEGKYPKFTLDIPEGGMEADVWNKCQIEISNIGELYAKNVNISISGNLEVKGIERIEKIEIGETWQVDIGIKPKEAGKLDMNVVLAYQRAFDDTIYQLNIGKNIIADASGTYMIEEVLLIHNSGILISQASRKMETELDRDIFSGMFTAVQDFIKDSFQRTDDVGLKRMDFGGNKILIEHGHDIFLTAILAGGEPRYLPLYMVEVIKELEEEYGAILEGWRGDLSQLEGIEIYIKKLLQVTDEKGADIVGFESGLVASTIRQIEEAEEKGVLESGQEAFINEFLENIEEGGFERAWSYLQNKGKEVEKEISTDTARTKISAMRDLMSVAKEGGMSEDEFLALIEEAERAIDAGNFEEIDNFQDKFQKKLEEVKLKQKTDIIWRRIKNAMVLISQFKEMGIDVEKPEAILALADKEFKTNKFESAKEHVDEAEKLAEDLRIKHDIKVELETVKETLAEIKEMKVDVQEAYDLLVEAENELNIDHFHEAKELIEKARGITSSNVEEYIQGKFPKFTLKLPKGGMEADYWNKCVIEIDNTGDLAAKNVDISFQGEVEVKGLDRLEKLDAGEKKQIEIGLKPKESGDLDTDVLLTYQRAFDDTIYQLTLGKKIEIDESGTYSIENVFLIHNSGILVTQVTRRLQTDVDSDVFSGMLTAIQDFVKDSFKRMEDVGLKRMDFGPSKLMIEHGRYTYLVAVLIGGEPKYLPLYMLEVVNEVEQKYGSVLGDWDGTYDKLGGLEELIEKLMKVTDEKGAEVEGFESGTVASTIRLIQAASEEGVDIVGPETFTNKLIEIIEKEGFENAWNYLEKMSREAEETSAEYRTKKEGMEELKHALLSDVDEHIIRDIGDSLEHYLKIVDGVIEVILGMRNESGLNETDPIKNVVIKSSEDEVRDAVTKFEIPIIRKVKAKNLELLKPGTEWQGLNLELIPKKEVIFRAYKQQASKVMTLLRYQSPWKIKESLEKEGEYTLGVEGYPVKITNAMLEFKLSTPENVVEKEFEKGKIYIDKELTEEMKSEGIVDELIGYINDMRKELKIKEEDYIETQIFVPDKTAEILEGQKELITSKTRSYSVEFPFDNIFEGGDSGYYVVEKELAGEKAVIGIVVVEWDEG